MNAPWKHSLWAALVTVLFLGALELGLALFGLPSSGIYDGDRYTDWRLKPNLDRLVVHESEGTEFRIQTSGDGFRDQALNDEPVDVVALGCSTTFGWGVEADEAWPQQLERMSGLNVLNAGVPGHSSHQGLRVALELLEREPKLLILGWMVRDSQRAARSDRAARAPTGLRKSRLYRMVARGREASESSGTESEHVGVRRVAPAEFRSNLDHILSAADTKGVPVLLLEFPMVDAEPEYQAVLSGLGRPSIAPQLSPSAFFSSDPIHLTPDGHRLLAEAVEPVVKQALKISEEDG